MRTLSFTLWLFFLFSSLSFAQDTLVRVNGDTLKGRVNIGLNSLKQEYATVKIGRKKEKLTLFEVREIRMGNGDLIKPLRYNNTYKFGKELIQGYLSYYRITRDNSTQKFDTDLLYKMDGTHLLLGGKLGFRSSSKDFLGDCSRIADDLNNKKYARNDLKELVGDYNTCVSQKGIMSKTAIEEKAKQDLIDKKQLKKLEMSKSLEQKLSDFATLLEQSDKISNKSDVTAMFNDVAGKLRRKETVPNYLKVAMTDALKTDAKLQKLITEIFKKE